MQYAIASNISGFFETDEFNNSRNETLSDVIQQVRSETGSQEFIDFLDEKQVDYCTICVIDFENLDHVFLQVELIKRTEFKVLEPN